MRECATHSRIHALHRDDGAPVGVPPGVLAPPPVKARVIATTAAETSAPKVTVREANVFTIFFEGDGTIEISLRAEDYPQSGEALLFQGREGQWVVI